MYSQFGLPQVQGPQISPVVMQLLAQQRQQPVPQPLPDETIAAHQFLISQATNMYMKQAELYNAQQIAAMGYQKELQNTQLSKSWDAQIEQMKDQHESDMHLLDAYSAQNVANIRGGAEVQAANIHAGAQTQAAGLQAYSRLGQTMIEQGAAPGSAMQGAASMVPQAGVDPVQAYNAVTNSLGNNPLPMIQAKLGLTQAQAYQAYMQGNKANIEAAYIPVHAMNEALQTSANSMKAAAELRGPMGVYAWANPQVATMVNGMMASGFTNMAVASHLSGVAFPNDPHLQQLLQYNTETVPGYQQMLTNAWQGIQGIATGFIGARSILPTGHQGALDILQDVGNPQYDPRAALMQQVSGSLWSRYGTQLNQYPGFEGVQNQQGLQQAMINDTSTYWGDTAQTPTMTLLSALGQNGDNQALAAFKQMSQYNQQVQQGPLNNALGTLAGFGVAKVAAPFMGRFMYFLGDGLSKVGGFGAMRAPFNAVGAVMKATVQATGWGINAASEDAGAAVANGVTDASAEAETLPPPGSVTGATPNDTNTGPQGPFGPNGPNTPSNGPVGPDGSPQSPFNNAGPQAPQSPRSPFTPPSPQSPFSSNPNQNQPSYAWPPQASSSPFQGVQVPPGTQPPGGVNPVPPFAGAPQYTASSGTGVLIGPQPFQLSAVEPTQPTMLQMPSISAPTGKLGYTTPLREDILPPMSTPNTILYPPAQTNIPTGVLTGNEPVPPLNTYKDANGGEYLPTQVPPSIAPPPSNAPTGVLRPTVNPVQGMPYRSPADVSQFSGVFTGPQQAQQLYQVFAQQPDINASVFAKQTGVTPQVAQKAINLFKSNPQLFTGTTEQLQDYSPNLFKTNTGSDPNAPLPPAPVQISPEEKMQAVFPSLFKGKSPQEIQSIMNSVRGMTAQQQMQLFQQLQGQGIQGVQ